MDNSFLRMRLPIERKALTHECETALDAVDTSDCGNFENFWDNIGSKTIDNRFALLKSLAGSSLSCDDNKELDKECDEIKKSILELTLIKIDANKTSPGYADAHHNIELQIELLPF